MRKDPFPFLPRVVAAAVLGIALGGGCATSAMKGTPFYTGEYTSRAGAPEDRVNLWPLLYYRDPALSVLWPIGEYSDTHLALRPLLSFYRRAPDKPYTKFNVLWPLAQFDTLRDAHRIFPLYWSEDSLVAFPLYWHFDQPFAGPEGSDALFPLWIYRRGPHRRDLHLAWPFARFHTSPTKAGWRVWPIAGHQRDRRSPRRSSFWLWPLGASKHSDARHTSRFLPFYLYEEAKDDTLFCSLPWVDRQRPGRHTRAIPAALSWHTRTAAGDTSLTLLLGLYRESTSAGGQHRSHLFPFYSQGPGHWISPLYARRDTEHHTLRVVPPLLSWQRRDLATGATSLYAAAGLFHRRRGTDGRDRDWLLPFYGRDEADGTLVTPLWARQRQADGTSAWSAIPPLLSWRSRDPATGAASLYAAAGLFHRRRGAEGSDRDWLLPLYGRDERSGLFLSPFYAARHAPDGRLDWAFVPPLLSFRRGSQDGTRDTLALAGLVRWGRDPQGRSHSQVLPFYSQGPGRFVCPIYATWSNRQGHRIQAIPPLLAWQGSDPATGRGDRFALLGLFRTRIGVPAGEKAGHLVPFYAYDRGAGKLLTPLFGHWREGDVRHDYVATPLVGTYSGASRGYWVFPFLSTREDAQGRRLRILWGHRERWRDGRVTSSLFPAFHHERTGDAAPLLRAMDEGVPLAEWPSGKQGWETDWLLFGTRRHWVRAQQTLLPAPGAQDTPEAGTDSKPALLPTVRCEEAYRNGFFPLWRGETQREVLFQGGAKVSDRHLATQSLLLRLYDSRREVDTVRTHDYARRRVLWRLWHWERLNGDTTMDLFPGVTWDRRADGRRKFSFLWRFYRNEVDAEGRRSLDILFLPILRP